MRGSRSLGAEWGITRSARRFRLKGAWRITRATVIPCRLVVLLGALLGTWATATRVSAEDVFAVVSVDSLEITEGKKPEAPGMPWPHLVGVAQPMLVTIQGEGDVYVRWEDAGRPPSLAVRVPAPRDVAGLAQLPRFDSVNLGRGDRLRFRIPAERFAAANREAYWRVRLDHYSRLVALGTPGTAWFRWREQEARGALGMAANAEPNTPPRWRSQESQLERTFSLASGGRAISENLQLHRTIPTTKPGEPEEKLASLPEIAVPEFDWSARIKGLPEPSDTLAKLIPGDQHALLCPSFPAFVRTLEWAEHHGGTALRLIDGRSEDAGTQSRYRRQLGLSLGQIDRFLGTQMVEDVAITGGDPYFDTGTDMAVLLKAKGKTSEVLLQSLRAKVMQASETTAGATQVEGEVLGVPYTGARTDDRRLCSYVLRIDDVVVVANSLQQLGRIVATQRGEVESLHAQAEFKFFRHRYARTDAGELGFLILTDKAIRRWCGPKWRIAESRRIRSAAVVAHVQAKQVEPLARGEATAGEVPGEFWVSDGDSLVSEKSGVRSTLYGGLAFQTPISELEFDSVSAEEARLYRRWRDGYQANWSTYFDPIAARLAEQDGTMSVDLSVMPLIVRSDYREFVDITRGIKLGELADPHDEALWHIALAINPDSRTLKMYAGFLGAFAPQIKVDPLSWLGNAVSLYGDQDPVWAEIAKKNDARNLEELISKHLHRLPIALRCEVRNPLKLTAFLVGLRAFAEQAAPGMAIWETKEHRGVSYVKISPTEQALSNGPNPDEYRDAALYYVASGDAWVISPREDVIHRSIDRTVARRELRKTPATSDKAPLANWLGDSFAVNLNVPLEQFLANGLRREYVETLRRQAWMNLAILNEWKRMFPDRDPVEMHQQLWHRRLVCPSGQPYRWNEKDGTMESTAFGHPGDPREPDSLPNWLGEYPSSRFGLTFEPEGLSTRVELKGK